MHFVRQYFKLEGSRTVAQHEAFLEALHGDMSVRNQWMNNRVGFAVSDLAPYVASLSHAGAAVPPREPRQRGQSADGGARRPGGIDGLELEEGRHDSDGALAAAGGGQKFERCRARP